MAGASNAEHLLARKTAEEYRSKGYEVTLDAPLDFFPGYRADLLARKAGEVTVIEVKSRSSLAADARIRELARVVDAKPGWSFELLLVAEPEKLDSPEGARPFDLERILQRLGDADRALASGASESALLLAWSAVEAATRMLVAEREGSAPDINAPGYFLDQAVFLGFITHEEYRRLVKVKQYRNAIAHAFTHDAFGVELVRDAVEIVRRMIADLDQIRNPATPTGPPARLRPGTSGERSATSQPSWMFDSFREHIRDDKARAAYDRFLHRPLFELLPRWAGKPGTKRSVSFTRSGKPKGGYYSFIVNRGSLLFYVRKPALCEAWTRQRAELQDHFGGRFRENPAGEWTVDVRTVDDVHYLETASCRTPYPMRHGDN